MLSRRPGLVLLSIGCAVLALACPSGNDNGTSREASEELIELNNVGTAYLGRFDWESASGAFSAARDLRPDHPIPINNLGVTRVQQNRLDEATELFALALATEGGFPWAHYNLGLLAKNDGDFAAAARHFQTVAAYDPRDLHTQYNLGSVLARLDRPDQAEAAFRAALAQNSTHVSTLYALGQFLMQTGRQEDGIALIQRSEVIRTRYFGETIGMQYGEQGRYAMGADYAGDALAAPAAIDITFLAGSRVVVGPGASWTLGAAAGVPALIVPGAEGDVPSPGEVRALTAADVDNDGTLDLVALVDDRAGLRPLVRLGDREWDGDRFTIRGSVAGDSVAMTAVDKDHDGDLDLFWCASGGCVLAVNDGAAHFEVDTTLSSGFDTGALKTPIEVAFADMDNDRDIDLLVADADTVRLYSNQRDGRFTAIDLERGPGPGPGGGPLAVADLNKDGAMDLLLGGAMGLRWLANDRGSFGAAKTLVQDPVAGVVVTDVDNDGFLDLVFDTAGGIGVLHNRGTGVWERRDDLFPDAVAGAVPVASWDIDGDGDLDLALRQPDGSLVLHINDGGNANRSITLIAEGVGDNRFGIGAKVEILAGALRQKFELTRPVPLVVGLGSRESVQSVRLLWPSGVLQDEINLVAAETATITQLDRKGTSCPLLYAWRDGAWQFVTDFLGGAAIGYQKAPGVFSMPDTDEYVLIENGLSESEGWLRLRLNNQLEEVLWFDQAELVVVDHPAGSRVFPNERLMPAPPWPDFRLFASRDVRPVARATDGLGGADLTQRLRELDRSTADAFGLLPFKGYAETHVLELDLGPFDQRDRVVLLLDGWIDYADSSANVAAAQAGAALVPPRLSVADGSGRWLEASERMGFPAGLPKTMSVDLEGLFPSADHRVRIETNMRIYWDRARVMVGGAGLPLAVQRLPVVKAELRPGGFPRATSPDLRKPYAYDPASVDTYGGWKAHVGAYTGYGEVASLLRSVDDVFVTTRGGDEIELRFAAPEPPAAGLVRTYLLYADGFGKDMDPNSAAAAEVGPMPFHGMPYYPYGPEVQPPARPLIGAPPDRRVLPDDNGLPGVLPQVLAARAGQL